MNAVTQFGEAFEKAGMRNGKVTLKYRIWYFLHDSNRANVGLTAKDVSSGVGIEIDYAYRYLSSMKRWGMVEAVKDGKGNVYRYKAVGQRYVARTDKTRKKVSSVCKIDPVVDSPVLLIDPKVVKVNTILDSLTLSEARLLYNKLCEFFQR